MSRWQPREFTIAPSSPALGTVPVADGRPSKIVESRRFDGSGPEPGEPLHWLCALAIVETRRQFASMASEFIADRRLIIGDVELEVFHQGGGVPMLILHGGDGLDHRARFLELLASQFEIIAPSHPGFGSSPLPDHFDGV